MWLKIKRERVRTQDWLTLPQKLYSIFLAKVVKNFTKQHKCTLKTFKTQSYTLQDYTKICATPYFTSTNVNPIQM